jgi:hypothetical protein
MDIISKTQAKDLGAKKYFTGKPCPNNHLDERYVSTSCCVSCQYNWYINNKEKNKISVSNYNENNKEKVKASKKKYTDSHKKEKAEYGKAHKKANKDYYNKQYREKYENDINFKLSVVLRSRLRMAIYCDRKGGSAVSDLGYSIEFFKSYLESKFLHLMTWENWNTHGWHIDHIIPISSFDLSDREQVLKACHYTNMQPLWSTDNLMKGDKIQ